MTKAAFVKRMVAAVRIAKAKGAVINAEAVVAQAALESGWGDSSLAAVHNNLFGIKAYSDWTGGRVSLPTLEYIGGKYVRVRADWRTYPSWNECVVDYGRLVARLRWFKDALPHADPPHGDGDARAWIAALVNVGEPKWATGPDYVNKVIDRVGREVARIQKEGHA